MLRALAPGKVNLSLFLGGTRADGRHELVTAIESVSLADELTLSIFGGSDSVVCAGVSGRNLALDALWALRAAGWGAPAVRLSIVKRVPVAAGMGGGSADAAAAFRLAGAFDPLPDGFDLVAAASDVGADVPSQLAPGLTLGVGAGDEITAVAAIADHELVIVPLDFSLSTAAVYAQADRLALGRSSVLLADLRDRLLDALSHGGARLSEELLVNDLEPAAISLCPEIAVALDEVRAAGADHAFLAGSGPTVVGLFWGFDGRARLAAEALAAARPRAIPVVPVDSSYGEPQPVGAVRHNLYPK